MDYSPCLCTLDAWERDSLLHTATKSYRMVTFRPGSHPYLLTRKVSSGWGTICNLPACEHLVHYSSTFHVTLVIEHSSSSSNVWRKRCVGSVGCTDSSWMILGPFKVG